MMDPIDQDLFGQHPDLHDIHGQRAYRQSLYSQNPYIQNLYSSGLPKDDHFTFPSQNQRQVVYQDIYGTYVVNPPQHPDDFYVPYGPEFADFVYTGTGQDEFGDMEEISTRPRLTKDQVEVLETQFQENHKPNSQLKRQLAFETKLTLPRVANWFQNRRAKAKQQRKQEEFEAQNGSRTDSEQPTTSSKANSSGMVSPAKSLSSPSKQSAHSSEAQNPSTPTKERDVSKEASWASLQRALNQAKVARAQQHTQGQVPMPPPELPQQPTTIQLPLRMSHAASASHMSMDSWPKQRTVAQPYPSPITLQDTTFDFGFGDETFNRGQAAEQTQPAVDYNPQSFVVVTPEGWEEPMATPTNIVLPQTDTLTALPSPGLSMPSYPGSRRQSNTEDLANNFGNFDLASSSPNIVAARRQSETIRAPESGNLDIAARRKRPRPAALTSSSLRSRSYGAVTSASPTFRQGIMTPQAPHTVRHVKSAGHGLNSRFAGVRKASSAQRSPACVQSFAEAEAFRQLMDQQAVVAQTLGDLPQPVLSPDIVSGVHILEPEKTPFYAPHIEMHHQYQRPVHVATASPPITPMAADFMSRGLSQQSLIPPASAPPQFASFPDYTPPYSAGPLTSSSWSDAPLTSPDVASFPPVTYVPSLGYPQRSDRLPNNYHNFVLPSDNNTDLTLESQSDRKKTEFFIQEFPNQKQAHAHVAQQLAQQKPRSYVFNNSAPQDYDLE